MTKQIATLAIQLHYMETDGGMTYFMSRASGPKVFASLPEQDWIDMGRPDIIEGKFTAEGPGPTEE